MIIIEKSKPALEEIETVEATAATVRPAQVQNITLDEFAILKPTPTLNLPDIAELECYVPKDGRPYMVYLCEATKRYLGGCPNCGSIDHHVHGVYPELRLVHDVNVGRVQVDIYLKVRRHICNDCSSTFREPFPSVFDSHQMTYRLYDQIRRDAFRRPFNAVAANSGFSATTIAAIFDEYAAELEAHRGPVVAPRVLGIDEKHIVHAKRGVFVDIETGQLLEMTADNTEHTVKRTIENMVDYDENIKIVTMDMSGGYRSWVHDILPNAKIVVDKYHVIQDMSLKVKRTKSILSDYLIRQVAQIPDAAERAHKQNVLKLFTGSQYLFKYNHQRLSSQNEANMADLCSTFPEINHLRLLKEGIERIYEATERKEAKRRIDAWLALAPPQKRSEYARWEAKYQLNIEQFREFQALRKTVISWEKELLNYFRDTEKKHTPDEPEGQYTNAATEGLNQLVDSLNRLGNGYSFKRLRARALFCKEAAPIIRYTAKEFKKLVPKGPHGLSNLPQHITTTIPYLPVNADDYISYHSIEPDNAPPSA